MKDFILTKLKEGSTWNSIAFVIAGMTFIPHAELIGQSVGIAGTAVATLLGIWFK